MLLLILYSLVSPVYVSPNRETSGHVQELKIQFTDSINQFSFSGVGCFLIDFRLLKVNTQSTEEGIPLRFTVAAAKIQMSQASCLC